MTQKDPPFRQTKGAHDYFRKFPFSQGNRGMGKKFESFPDLKTNGV